MSDVPYTVKSLSEIHFAGVIALASGVISVIGVVLFIAMYALFAAQQPERGSQVGMFNDICVAIQYLLTIPIALVLYRILSAYQPRLIRMITITGIVSLLIVFGLQMLLIFRVLTFEQQLLWISLAMILGVGSWLVVTGMVARSTGKLPNSLLMSSLAVPYFGYPLWAFWIGLQLLGW